MTVDELGIDPASNTALVKLHRYSNQVHQKTRNLAVFKITSVFWEPRRCNGKRGLAIN